MYNSRERKSKADRGTQHAEKRVGQESKGEMQAKKCNQQRLRRPFLPRLEAYPTYSTRWTKRKKMVFPKFR